MRRYLIVSLIFIAFLTACAINRQERTPLVSEGEIHLRHIKQLTDGGENAEAYFSFDGRSLIFQSTSGIYKCDQIFIMNRGGSNKRLVSTGMGRTTCSYFLKGGNHIIYASTHAASPDCPPTPDYKSGYKWSIYKDYDIYLATVDGKIIKNLTSSPGYDAEATVSPDGKTIIFTSTRNGDLDLYTMNTDGSNVKQLTNDLGYDGGAFFSPDGNKICYRAYHPDEKDKLDRYFSLLKEGFIEPVSLQIFIANADGSGKKQLTDNGAANFCPFFHPDGKRIIFASNMENPMGHNFDLYTINIDGSKLERITYHPAFDGFPMFSPDGKKLVFCSNRHNRLQNETNVFIADWVE